MSLKSALFEMKEALNNHEAKSIEEEYIRNLEDINKLKPGTLFFYVNNLMMLAMNNNDHQNNRNSKKVNRKWTKNEIEFMFQYIEERQAEGALNITEILEETAHLLNRGYQSVNYKYYTLVKAKEKSSPQHTQYTTIEHKDVPVVSVGVLDTLSPAGIVNLEESAQGQEDDLLDILSGLITNIQQLPGLNLNELLRSLYQLTNMALLNQGAIQQMESLKSEVNLEKEALREKLALKDQQLMQEKKRNNELQREVAKLVKEISAFNKLGDAAKIQNLKTYNQRLNYLVDGFGVVHQVGS